MYHRILLALDNSPSDNAILEHIQPMVKLMNSELLLVHVADGLVAQQFDDLTAAQSPEMRADRAYLEQVRARLENNGIAAEPLLLLGDPAQQMAKLCRARDIDLIAMSTHGHRFLSDIVLGSTVDKLRHLVDVPLLLLKAPPK